MIAFPFECAAALRDLVGLEPVDPAQGREEEDVVVGAADEGAGDEVLLLRLHLDEALPAPTLPAVAVERQALHVAVMGDEHDLRRCRESGPRACAP